MIDEIPIENSDVIVEAETVVDDHVVEIVTEAKKGRGRPKGVVNKPKAAPKAPEPKAKMKAKAKKKPVIQEYEEESDDEYEPVQQPQYNTRDIASEVINMLSNRHLDRSNLKREKYRSWFN